MGESLFKRANTDESPQPLSPHEIIEHEIAHLRKGSSTRYGDKKQKRSLWLVVLGACGLAWLYLMDPLEHAWYKGEAVRAYTYLHNYGAGNEATLLATSGILSPDEIHTLDDRHGSYQDYYVSPSAASDEANTIISYLATVKLLHAGRYEQLDPVGRMRYLLFIRTGLILPKSWDFLDPSVNS